MKRLLGLLLVAVFVLTGCSSSQSSSDDSGVSVQSISADETLTMLEEGSAVLIDVREQSEYDEGHIANSILVPLGTVESDISNVVDNKDDAIIIYCRSGNRSNQAANLLINLGYTNVYDLGGIIDWPYDIVE